MTAAPYLHTESDVIVNKLFACYQKLKPTQDVFMQWISHYEIY